MSNNNNNTNTHIPALISAQTPAPAVLPASIAVAVHPTHTV